MKNYLLVNYLDELGLFHDADIMEEQIIREAQKKNYWPLLIPASLGIINGLSGAPIKENPTRPKEPEMSVEVEPSAEKADFNEFLSFLDELEGGYSDRPLSHDPGGKTMSGVTQHDYDLYRQILHKKGHKSVKNLTPDEKRSIYKELYWNKIKGNELPKYTAVAINQWKILGGPAVSTLQKLVGIEPTGNLGPRTIEKIHEYIGGKESLDKQLALKLCDYQEDYLHSLPNYKYNPGWDNRVEKVREFIKNK